MLNIPKLIIVCCAVLSLCCVQATSPPQFLKDINGYRSACKSIGWEPKQGKSPIKILTHKPCYCFVVLLSHNNEIQIFYIVLFITKNHTVHRFNVCTRNIIKIENHEYIYQIIAVIMQGDT